jgi:hypothetical protein
MHSGFNLVSGIIRAFGSSPYLGEFLDARLIKSPHLNQKSLTRKAIKAEKTEHTDNQNYGTMIAMPWQDINTLKEELFDPNAFATSIEIRYFDIPSLHEFGAHGC